MAEVDSGSCKDCRHFKAGVAPAVRRVNMAFALAGRWPSTEVTAAAMMADKHGVCAFMPEEISKYSDDGCGQFKGRG